MCKNLVYILIISIMMPLTILAQEKPDTNSQLESLKKDNQNLRHRLDKLEKGILKVINNDQLIKSMQIAARKKAKERFEGKRNADLILDYLNKIVEEQKG